jgi:RNA polymerase sigma-70 factor, ECF subfamily
MADGHFRTSEDAAVSASEPVRQSSADEFVPLVYDELRAIAHAYFHKQAASFTLRPTELVNEACLQLLRHASGQWQSPEHFRAIATKKIWQVIVDHLKRRYAQKRGGIPNIVGQSSKSPETAPGSAAVGHGQRVPLESVCVEWRDQTIDLLDLADALEDLAAESRRLRDIVMLHWFGGLTYAEVAQVLGFSASTIEKDFRYALAWLNRRLAGGAADAH